jgi:ATP-dependent DNA helicase RecG
MECSRLTEKPRGRKEIDTRVIPSQKIGSVVEGLHRVIEKGEKIYWICPLVEESEKSELAAVLDKFAAFRKIFGEKVGVVHGRMKPQERNEIMLQFRDGNIDILIATTVIEVGVDVPLATTIIIEHAERFGLSQLHQLRGRVGRNDKQSTCLLIYYGLGEVAAQRLTIMRSSNDGFRLAEEDLKIRGGGDLIGEKQSGLPSFKIANLYEHTDLFQEAGHDAAEFLALDPHFQSPRGKALLILLNLFEYNSYAQFQL